MAVVIRKTALAHGSPYRVRLSPGGVIALGRAPTNGVTHGPALKLGYPMDCA